MINIKINKSFILWGSGSTIVTSGGSHPTVYASSTYTNIPNVTCTSNSSIITSNITVANTHTTTMMSSGSFWNVSSNLLRTQFINPSFVKDNHDIFLSFKTKKLKFIYCQNKLSILIDDLQIYQSNKEISI
jgi:hypothetical protein